MTNILLLLVLVSAATTASGKCITSCDGVADGDYQSCTSCQVYASCSNGNIMDNRPCPAGLAWDDFLKRCEYTSGSCPSGCPSLFNFTSGNSCFYYSDSQQTYYNAKETCKTMAPFAKLAEPKTAELDSALIAEAKRLARVTGLNGYWVGLDDLATEGSWVYNSDDTAVTFTSWYPGEPNNRDDEDCLMYWADRDFAWNDFRCGDMGYFICQYDQ